MTIAYLRRSFLPQWTDNITLNMKHAFIFDMDGVIVDSNPFHKIALKQFCNQYGEDLTEEQLKEKVYGRTNKDWLTNLFGDLGTEKLTQYAYEKELLFRQLFDKDIRPLDGLIQFLDKLDKYGIPRAVATSAPKENVDFTLEKTGTTPYFKTVLDDSFVSQGKPNPEIYLKTAKAIGLDPALCVVFEDSLSGVKAGKAAGCKVVGVMTTHSAEELQETDLVIRDFQGLDPQELISRLF
jgi:beta-phosphoglucomutase